MKKSTIIISGGGTGGHAVPMISVAQELDKKLNIIIFGGFDPIEEQIFKGIKYPRFRIISGKIHRYHSLKSYLDNILNLIKLLLGIIQSTVLFVYYRPAVVFSKGGYVSLPVSFTASLFKVPIILHESDLTPGLANRIVARYASKIAVSFPPQYYNLPLMKIVYSGHIIRPEIYLARNANLKELKNKLGFTKNKTLLITGGSQGALIINKTLAKILPSLLADYNVIHLSGVKDYSWLKDNQRILENGNNYYLKAFSKDISELMALSDLIITRAGSNTLAEIAALKKPAIIIPYRYAAGNHQMKNAEYFQRIGGGQVIEEKNLNPALLLEEINKFINDQRKLTISGENSFKENSFNGAKIIAQEIMKLIK